MPLITIIIPNYNHEAFLERRIKSVLNQTFQDFEIILLDDYSTDNSRSIIDRYKDHPKVKQVVYNEQNSGSPYKQWKKGIDLAETEWIWIAESDDSSSPTLLESLEPAFKEATCSMAFAEVVFVNEAGFSLAPARQLAPKWWQGENLVKEKLLLNNEICNAGMVVFRRQAAIVCGNHFKDFILAGDWWLWSHIACMGKAYACGQPLAFFTRHPKELSIKYLDTTVQYNEHDHILESLLKKNIITRKDLEWVIHTMMVKLECIRKGMQQEEYIKRQGRWIKFAENNQVKINRLQVFLGAKYENLKFALKK